MFGGACALAEPFIGVLWIQMPCKTPRVLQPRVSFTVKLPCLACFAVSYQNRTPTSLVFVPLAVHVSDGLPLLLEHDVASCALK